MIQFDREIIPEIQWNHIDGPLLHLSNGRLHWLTLWERLLCWLGLENEFTLDVYHVKK